MNRRLMKGFIAAIVIIVANIGLFLFTESFSATFWICYIFTMLAALVASFVEVFYINDKPIMLVYELTAITALYLVVQLIVGSVCRHLLFLFPARAFFLQLCILAIYMIVFLFVTIHGSHVAEQQQVRARDQVNFKFILEAMKSAASKMDYSNPQRKMVQHAYDSLASGQVTSSDSVYDIEQQIISSIEDLKNAIMNKDDASVEQICKTIENLADERKTKLNVKNPF